MTPKEALLNKQIDLDDKAAVTRLAGEYLFLLSNRRLIEFFPDMQQHINDLDDDRKQAITTELSAVGAIEVVDGVLTPTEKGLAMNAQLTAVALKHTNA